MEKTCRVCNIKKPLDEFHLKKTGNLGRAELCKKCKKKKDSDRNKKGLSEKEKERRRLYSIKYYENNKDKFKEYGKRRPKEYWNEYKKKRRESHPIHKLQDSIRTRVNKYLRDNGYFKNKKTFSIIGLTPQRLKEYLSENFEIGMSWDNYGEWHIDHIVPLSSAKTEEELYKLFYYTNLQPLWAADNLKKSDKLDI